MSRCSLNKSCKGSNEVRILIIDIDSLSPAHLGCYGYHRNTSPNIDAIAAKGLRFTNYYTTDAPCLPSRTALMSGQFGIHTGVVGHGGSAADLRIEGPDRGFRDRLSRGSLPGLLRTAGLRTALVSPFAERHSAWSFYAGFNEMYNTGKGGLESGEEVTPVVLDWLDRNARSEDWCLYVNYWDPHTPYRAPESFGNPFADDPLPPWMTEELLARHLQKVGPHSAREINMFDNASLPGYPRQPGEINDMSGLRRVVDGYDCGIRYVDEHVGRILEALRRQGLGDEEVAIILTADHGENVGQLGIYGEHATADQATCNIPMIIRWPGTHGGTTDEALHYHLDLGPTLAELLDQEAPDFWDGESYAATINEGRQLGRRYLVLSQCAHVCQRSVRFDEWLYIRTYHDGFHLFDREMLFDIRHDPNELRDRAHEEPAVCRKAVYLLNDWHDGMMGSMRCDIDPMWTVINEGGPFHAKGRLREYAKRLEATGRGAAIEELKRRHPSELA